MKIHIPKKPYTKIPNIIPAKPKHKIIIHKSNPKIYEIKKIIKQLNTINNFVFISKIVRKHKMIKKIDIIKKNEKKLISFFKKSNKNLLIILSVVISLEYFEQISIPVKKPIKNKIKNTSKQYL